MVTENTLSALLVVFAVMAGLLVVLFAGAGLLARRHAVRRTAYRVRLLARPERSVGSDAELDPDLATLTTGDLVMDRRLAVRIPALAWPETGQRPEEPPSPGEPASPAQE